jgi:hypothetical protein
VPPKKIAQPIELKGEVLSILGEHKVTSGINFDAILTIAQDIQVMNHRFNLRKSRKDPRNDGYEKLILLHLDQLEPLLLKLSEAKREEFLIYWFSYLRGAGGLLDHRDEKQIQRNTSPSRLFSKLKKLQRCLREVEKDPHFQSDGSSLIFSYLHNKKFQLKSKLSGLDSILSEAIAEMNTNLIASKGARGPKKFPEKSGYVAAGVIALKSLEKGRKIRNLKPIFPKLIEKPNLNELYEFSPLKLLADALYLAGLQFSNCSERHLRKEWQDCKQLLGEDLYCFFPEIGKVTI